MKRALFSRLRVLGIMAAMCLASVGLAHAQSATIRGSVTSENGPVEGALVFLTGLNLSASTGADGNYLIAVPAARVRGQAVQMLVRAIGHRPQSQTITLRAGAQTADFRMTVDINRLEEVVVTGVMEGTEQIRVPFVVARVDVADVPVPSVSPLQMLAGRVPGATVTTQSGLPGAAPTVQLRGPTAINASGRSQDPLYIVDGVEVVGGLQDINSGDIEGVEVVKGAAAASLYGARAGAGVIQITTKSGRRAAPGVSFTVRGEYGTSDIERSIGLSDHGYLLMEPQAQRFCVVATNQPVCARTIDWRNELARVNNNPGPDSAFTPQSFPLDISSGSASNVALANNFMANLWPGQTYDAAAQAIRPASFVSSQLDMTARIGETQIYTSFSQFHQGAPLQFLDGYDRTGARLNVTHRILSNLSAQLSTYYARSVQNAVYANEDYTGAFLYLTRAYAPTNLLQYDSLNRLYIRVNPMISGSQNSNPFGPFLTLKDIGVRNRFIGGLTLRYTPLTWLDMESSFSYDYRGYNRDEYYSKGRRVTTQAQATWFRGRVARSANTDNSMNVAFNVTARRNFGRDLSTRWSLRYTYEQQDYQSNTGSGTLLNAMGIDQLDNATQSTYSVGSYNESTRQIGYFAGVNMEYKDRYVLDALVRRDGSSLFGAAHRWATFGRGSLAWRVSKESWWPFRNAMNEFKLRASRGSAGGRPRFTAQYETFSVGTAGITIGNLGNANLGNETNTETEVGADIELFHRVGLTITRSVSTIENQILEVPQPAVQGYLYQWMNAGTLQNKGWELSLNVPVIRSRNLSWSWRFNYDAYRSVITKLNVAPYYFGTAAQATETMFQAKQGEQLGTFYGKIIATNCEQLPAPFSADCGTPTSSFQRNTDGWIVWVGAGNNIGDGITKNLWATSIPGCRNHTTGAPIGCILPGADTTAPWGFGVNWGMPIRVRNPNGTLLIDRIGHALPKFHFSISQTLQWRRLSVYAMLEGLIGRDIWNKGLQWMHLDLNSSDVDQSGQTVQDAKPVGYYWRGYVADGAPAGLGGLYDILSPSSFWMEDGSFAKLRELSISYRLGNVGGFGDWSVSLIGRNLFTITKYRGFDPEVGLSSGNAASAYINAVDSFNFPGTRSFTVSLTSSF